MYTLLKKTEKDKKLSVSFLYQLNLWRFYAKLAICCLNGLSGTVHGTGPYALRLAFKKWANLTRLKVESEPMLLNVKYLPSTNCKGSFELALDWSFSMCQQVIILNYFK
jgi:hypothetical protein